MPPRRLVLWVHDNKYDVTNLLDEQSLCNFLQGMTMSVPELQVQRSRPQRRPRPFEPLYPNPNDPCNRRLLEDPEMPYWEPKPLEKTPPQANNYEEFFCQRQRRDTEQHQQQPQPLHRHSYHHQDTAASSYSTATGNPQRAQTAPLQQPPTPASTPTPATLARHTSTSRPRQSLPPIQRQSLAAARRQQQQQRHSTTTIPGDIESSSSGLRPKLNYRALYNRGRNLSASSASSSCHSISEEDVTDSTAMMSSSAHLDHEDYGDPVGEEEEESLPPPQRVSSQPATMEIAPNIRVAVRSQQESYEAVRDGDYTVATCFACASTIVCVDNAAYILCPDCQVVSPLGFGTAPLDSSKKDDPHGIGTGLKREWVNRYIGT